MGSQNIDSFFYGLLSYLYQHQHLSAIDRVYFISRLERLLARDHLVEILISIGLGLLYHFRNALAFCFASRQVVLISFTKFRHRCLLLRCISFPKRFFAHDFIPPL